MIQNFEKIQQRYILCFLPLKFQNLVLFLHPGLILKFVVDLITEEANNPLQILIVFESICLALQSFDEVGNIRKKVRFVNVLIMMESFVKYRIKSNAVGFK